MTIKFKISYEPTFAQYDLRAILFDARKNFTAANYGSPVGVEVTVVECSADYFQKYGELDTNPRLAYGNFLADCFKYDFIITKVNGAEVKLTPFKTRFITNHKEIDIEIAEV